MNGNSSEMSYLPKDADAFAATPGPTAVGKPVRARAVGALDEVLVSNGVDREVSDRDAVVAAPGNLLMLRGWAANREGNAPARYFSILLNGTPIRAPYGFARSDVASAFDRKEMRNTGFRAVIPTAHLAAGRHAIEILTRDGTREEDACELASLVLSIDPHRASATLRSNTPGLFAIRIDGFHAENQPLSITARIEKSYIACVRGRARQTATGEPAAGIYGLVDGFDGNLAQIGLRGGENDGATGFLLCFPTHDLSYGSHELDLFATDHGGRLEHVDRLQFDVTPICCGVSVPIVSTEIANARIEWLDDAATADVGYVRGWALDPRDGDSVGKAFLAFADGRSIALATRQFRDDVPEAQSPKARFCGFVGSVAFRNFAPGHYVARVMVESKDQTRRHPTDATLSFTVP